MSKDLVRLRWEGGPTSAKVTGHTANRAGELLAAGGAWDGKAWCFYFEKGKSFEVFKKVLSKLYDADMVTVWNGGSSIGSKTVKEWASYEKKNPRHGPVWGAIRATNQRMAAVEKRDGTSCAYCGRPTVRTSEARPNQRQLDHVKPWSKGGRNTLTNLVICCRACNLAKGAR